MSVPFLPNPTAAIQTSDELGTAGARMQDAVDGVVSRISALQAGNPWGNDEAGVEYQKNLGDTGELTTAMSGLGQGVQGFGNIARTGVQNILALDQQSASAFDGFRRA